MALTKNGLMEILCNNTDIPKQKCKNLVESCFEIIKGELAKSNEVMISGFGKWRVRSKDARRGRNPQTGEALIVSARRVVTFHPSTRLRN